MSGNYKPTVKAYKNEEYEQSVRYKNGLTILFYSKESVYIRDKYNKIICNRWDAKYRGFYKGNWSPFIVYLKTKNVGSIMEIMEKALSLEINVKACVGKFPDTDNIKVLKERKRKKK